MTLTRLRTQLGTRQAKFKDTVRVAQIRDVIVVTQSHRQYLGQRAEQLGTQPIMDGWGQCSRDGVRAVHFLLTRIPAGITIMLMPSYEGHIRMVKQPQQDAGTERTGIRKFVYDSSADYWLSSAQRRRLRYEFRNL